MTRFFIFISLLAPSLFLCIEALAEEKQPSLSKQLYDKLQQADKSIANKSYAKAEQQLLNLLQDTKKGTFEHATVLRSIASVYALKEQYNKAADFLNQAISLNILPKKQQSQAVLNLGQLYLASNQYQRAINTLKPWLNQNSVKDPETNAMLANAYMQLKQYRKALKYISNAIREAKNPNDSWYQLQLALYFELKDYGSAAKALQTLLKRNPDNQKYWSQLISVYQLAKDYKRATSIKHLAYKSGLMISEKDILELANLFLYVGSPYKAGKLLEQEIANKRIHYNSKNLELLANSWTQAQEYEKAISALNKAASLNNKGELFLRLGQIYFEQEKWHESIDALSKAINKGGLSNPGNAWLMLGISQFENKKANLASQAFTQALKFSTSRKAANQWLSYIKDQS